MTSESLDQQNVSVWGWTNSINSFVENTKTASESFFDNVSATLAKKPTQETNIDTNIHNNDNKLPHQTPPHQPPEEKNQQESADPNNIFKCEIEEWKSKYSQSKTAYSLKIAMLQNELQKYKDTNSSFNRHISLQTESKIAKFQSQIQKYQQNEKKCINIFKEHIRQYYQNNDHLQHQIETKYKIFYEKLLNLTVKAGLDPNDIFESNDIDNNNNNKYETMSVISDFEEKEVIHNAEEHDIQNSENTDTEYKEKYLQAVEQCNILQEKNSEYNVVCNELSAERAKEKEEYQELVRLFELMSDKNTQFQQQIKDVDGENELLRKQLNQYKSQHESDMDALVLQNVNLKESFKELQVKYDEISNKLNDEYEIGEQLRQQIKQTAKISNKRNKSNTKLKKKIETFSKTIKTLEYEIDEKNKKLTKYIERIKEFEYTENKYNNAICSYKSLQNEIEEYIEESNELKRKIYNLEDEILTNKQHSNELRKQANRDRKNISRLTNCNDELINILTQCQDILTKSAHKYLSVSVLNAQELELSDTDSDDDYNDAGNGNIIYFNDSDSDDDDVEEEDDIFIVSKEKDIKALQLGARLKIQVSMLSEQLKTFQDNMNNLKHKLHRKEEETLQQQYELRQVAMRRRLEAKIKKELRKRENKMVTIASVRGLNIRHKTSLANLTKTQDEVNRIVHDIEENDELWKRNISRQLSGNTKSSSMDLLLMDSLSGSTMASTSLNKRDILETQSMHSLSSANSKKSMHSQTMSLSMHNRRHKQRVRRSAAMQPMQTMQMEKNSNDKKKKSFNFASKWFK